MNYDMLPVMEEDRLRSTPPHIYDRLASLWARVSPANRPKRLSDPLLCYDVDWAAFVAEHRAALNEAYQRAPDLRVPWRSMLVEDRSSLCHLGTSDQVLAPGVTMTLSDYRPMPDPESKLASVVVDSALRWLRNHKVPFDRAFARSLQASKSLVLIQAVSGTVSHLSVDTRGAVGWYPDHYCCGITSRETVETKGIDAMVLTAHSDGSQDDARRMGEHLAGVMQTAIEQASLACIPFGWVVERQEVAVYANPAKPTLKEKVRRASDFRTLHIVLTNEERKSMFRHSEPRPVASGNQRRSPRSHARRGHWRRNHDGRIVWINSTWVGPEIVEQCGVRYRVRLDV